jgi:hypothetical protein
MLACCDVWMNETEPIQGPGLEAHEYTGQNWETFFGMGSSGGFCSLAMSADAARNRNHIS